MWVAILWTDRLSLTDSVAVEGSKQVQKSPSLVTAAPILLLPRPSGFICNMTLVRERNIRHEDNVQVDERVY